MSTDPLERACPNFLAALNRDGGSIGPEVLPLAASFHGIEGGDGRCIGAVPAATVALETLRTELALGFRRPTANLPALRPERGVANHFPAG